MNSLGDEDLALACGDIKAAELERIGQARATCEEHLPFVRAELERD